MSRIKNYPTPDLPTLENIFEYQKFEYPLGGIPKNNMHENLHVFTAESCQWRCVIALSFNLEAGGRPRAENPHDMQTQAKELIRSRNSIIMDKRIQLSL